MVKLCGFRISNYYNKVRIVLLEKGIEHEEDASCYPKQTDEFLARTPVGKVPFLELGDGRTLAESDVICEYLEDACAQKPLLPKDPLERAKVRELTRFMELHLELVARQLYGAVFFKRPLEESATQAIEKDLLKGVRGLKALAKFDPYIAGREFTLADCAAAAHLPVVSVATKLAYGRDFLADLPQLRPYLKQIGERPSISRVNEDRKAAVAAAGAK